VVVFIYCNVTDCMEQRPSWRADSRSALQEISSLPWSQDPTTGSSPESDEHTPHPQSLFLKIHALFCYICVVWFWPRSWVQAQVEVFWVATPCRIVKAAFSKKIGV